MLADPQFKASFPALTPQPYEYNIIGFDTEDNSAGEVMSFSFYDGGLCAGEKKFYYTTNVNDALRFVLEYPESSMFVAHNLEYDINNLFKECNFKYIDEEIRTPKMIKVTLLGSKNFFYNSNAFFFSSLAKMGEVVGLPKLEGEEQDRFNPNYVIRDSQIVYEYMTRLQKTINSNYNMRLRPTIGSLSMALYRTHFMQTKKQPTYNNPELLKAYYGGRTEIFYKGIVKGPIRIPDINSSYPNVMYKYEFPDTGTLTKSSIYTHKFGIGKFKIHVPEDTFLPVLPYKSPEGKLFFPVGTFTGYWTYAEVNTAIKYGAKILKEYDGVGTNRGCRPFKEFVENSYNPRQEAKKLIKKLEKLKKRTPAEETQLLIAKMDSEEKKGVLNNLYGKFAQHRSNGVLVRRPLTEAQIEKKIKGEYVHSRLGPFHEYKSTEDNPAPTANYMWGIYVTSYARLELYKHLYKVHSAGGTLLYCDTDSIMYSGDIPKGTLDLGSELGQLEYETVKDGQSSFDMALFRQAKGYLICNETGKKKKGKKELEIVKVACKGVPTAHAYDFILRNMASFDKPMRQREYFISAYAKKSTLKRELGLNVWDTVEKHMNLEYIKRLGEGVTRPVNVDEIDALEENIKGATVETYEEKVKDFGYSIIRKEPAKVFTKVKIPKGWNKHHKLDDEFESKLNSKRMVLLKALYFRSLPDDTVWFSGYVESIHKNKFGEYMQLRLTQFEGEILSFCTLRAMINVSIFKKLKILKDLENIKDTLITVLKIDDEETKIEAVQNDKPIDFKELTKKERGKQDEKLIKFLIKKGHLNLNKKQ
jgi:hypothetical protein